MSNSKCMGTEFYRIVEPQHHSTRIPQAFVKYISQEKRETAVLKGPTGDCWRVKFSQTKEGAFLQDGWKEFTKGYSLGNLEVLFFRYDGDLSFNVEIFDKTACKRAYAFDVENNEEFLNFPVRKETEVPVESFAPVRRRPSKGKVSFPHIEGRGSRRKPPTRDQLRGVFSTAMSFKSELPFCKKHLSKSCVYKPYVLCLPAKFVKKHFPKHHTDVVLKNDKDLAWRVKFRFGKMPCFCGGWRAFVRDNQLEEEDICIFELLPKSEMRVHIFRCQIN